MIRTLLKQPNVDINYQGAVTVYFQLYFGQYHRYCALMCFTSQSGRSALHLAVQKGHNDVVRLLLRRGANTELRNLVSFSLPRVHEATAMHACAVFHLNGGQTLTHTSTAR